MRMSRGIRSVGWYCFVVASAILLGTLLARCRDMHVLGVAPTASSTLQSSFVLTPTSYSGLPQDFPVCGPDDFRHGLPRADFEPSSERWTARSLRVERPAEGGGISIGSWNAGGTLLLGHRMIPHSLRETIDVIDVGHNSVARMAEGHGDGYYKQDPYWVGSQGSIVYEEMDATGRRFLRVFDPSTKSEAVFGQSQEPLLYYSSTSSEKVLFLRDGRQLQMFDARTNTVANYLSGGADGLADLEVSVPNGYMTGFAASPDLSRVLIGLRPGVFWLADGSDRVCRVDLDQVLGVDGQLYGAAFSPNGRYIAAMGVDMMRTLPKPFVIIDRLSGQMSTVDWGHGRHVTGFAWAPDSSALAAMVWVAEVSEESGFELGYEQLVIAQLSDLKGKVQDLGRKFWQTGYYGLAWGPDMSQLVLSCPVPQAKPTFHADGEICVIQLQN